MDTTSSSYKNLSEPGGSGLQRVQHVAAPDPSTLRSKQDFTLGNVQKRTFVPTIPSTRRIKKESTCDSTAKKPGNKPVINTSRKGKRREKQDVIKSESVFSMGPAGKHTPERMSGPVGVSLSSDKVLQSNYTTKTRPTSTATAISNTQVQDEIEELVIPADQKLFQHSQLPPLQLPLELVLKAEAQTEGPKSPSADPEVSPNAAEILNTADHSYLLMQLPHSLPISVQSPQAAGSNEEEIAGVSPLSSVPEGRIGKLRIHKSGKVSLALGVVSLDISMGTSCGFLQELMCIRSSQEAQEATITSVGHILSHKIVCTPNFINNESL